MTGTPRVRLVVLDFDGTLADSFAWFRSVLGEVAERHGFRTPAPQETERLRGLHAAAIMRDLGVPLRKLPAIAAHLHRLAARDAAGIALFPGIDGMLADLSGGGLALAVLSSNAEGNVRRVLGPDNAGRIDAFACGASVFGKAARLRALLRRLAVDPAEALCVGDEVRDLDAARAVGCAFGAVAWGYTRPEALAGADALFREPADVAAYLRARPSPATGPGPIPARR